MTLSLHPAEKSQSPAARFVYERRESILVAWVERVKAEVPQAKELDKPIVINTIPLFILKLAEVLCEEPISESLIDTSNLAQEHGGERARITRYGPDQLIQEYAIMRAVLIEQLNAHVLPKERDLVIIQNSIDLAIQEAMSAYFLVHGRIREQFVATLTHDLRNPIGAVKSATEEILEVLKNEITAADVDDLKDLSQRILRSTRRADRMIQDLLDASVVQTGETLNLHITRCDLEKIVQRAIEEMPTRIRSRLKVSTMPIEGYWDTDALQRSIENLVNNAFKYGESERPVTLSMNNAHGRVMIAVHNYGNPIPAESRETIFQVFRRTHSAQKGAAKGWGIGLALARTTAERMGGSLGVESSLEKGTTFTIDIPHDARPYQNTPTSSGC